MLPAYNAPKLSNNCTRSPTVSKIILVDDGSPTKPWSSPGDWESMSLFTGNYGYGRNQQTCYREGSPATQTSWSWFTLTISTARYWSRLWQRDSTRLRCRARI